MTITGAEAMVRVLRENGLTTAFSLAGTAHTHLLAAMDRAGGFDVVSTRHETCTVLAADGYARTTGRVAVAMIKNEQGLPNAMTGICTANAACSPVVVLSSLAPSGSVEAGGERGAHLDMVAGHAKWSGVVPSADRLGEYINLAFQRATSGRPGVAVLGVPQNFHSARVPDIALPVHPRAARPAADPAAIAELADRLASAQRPLILVGAGARDAEAALRSFAQAYRIPVLGNSLGRGLVVEDNELGYSWPLAQVAAKDADLVIALGIRFTQRLGYGLPPRFGPEAFFAQVDICADEFARNRAIDLPIQADCGQALEALHVELARRGQEPFPEPRWVSATLQPRLARIDELGRDAAADIHPYAIGRALRKLLPADAVVVGDGADILNWLHGVYFCRSARSYMDHYPFGSMGVGTGLALGAAVGLREEARLRSGAPRTLVLLTGDGAFGFYCGELHSFAKAGLKIIVIVANDGAWGTEHHGQLHALGASYNCLLGKSDYQHIGEAFGFEGVKIERADAIEPAIAHALAAPHSSIINVLTDTEAGRIRKSDPRVQTIAFEDLASSLATHYTPPVA